jgi:general secretion pathway protein G
VSGSGDCVRRTATGLTLVELLVLVIVFGILTLIVLPGVYFLVTRRLSRVTLAELRTLGTCIESYSIDNCQYYSSAPTVARTLVPAMESTYVKKMPVVDGWGVEIRYQCLPNDYTFVSWGSDRRPGGGGVVRADGTTTDFRNDIVFSTGSFVEYPGGPMVIWPWP